MKKIISSNKAPSAIGPYSQAVKANGFVFCSGQIAFDPATMNLKGSTAAEQCRQVMDNLGQVLKAAGSDFSKAVKMTIYLKDMNDFGAVNEVYGSYFGSEPPARVCIEVARMPKDALVEIDAIALD